MKLLTQILGYPRIGEKRELKIATEAYWKGKISLEKLQETGKNLRAIAWKKQQAKGIDLIPCNDFSYYDQMLDMSCLLGNVPERFQQKTEKIDLDTLFYIARGIKSSSCGSKHNTQASEMTKWFNTNYHYIVPEFCQNTQFQTSTTKIFDEFLEAKDLGINAKPILIGPITYLSLGKAQNENFDSWSLIDSLISSYGEIIQKLSEMGAEWIQIDEPILSTDLDEKQKKWLPETYNRLSQKKGKSKLMIATYFDIIGDNREIFLNLKADALHCDAINGKEEINEIIESIDDKKYLSIGIINGRNIWKNDFSNSLEILQKAQKILGERLIISPSCSFLHSPVTLKSETKLDIEIKDWLAFTDEKITEIIALRDILSGEGKAELEANQKSIQAKKESSKIHKQAIKERVNSIQESDFNRQSSFKNRQKSQRKKLHLPLYPTTTIGSFPQTTEIRKARSDFKAGNLSQKDYEAFLEEKTRECIAFQEEIEIDMLVHGEFERNDMVEYFGEQLEGFAFTQFGWVQSYGSRCVKPPIIYGDISREKPMTVRWSQFAQTCTQLPMKGMLTGPVTILYWSFIRDDQPHSQTATQIALAIRDEVIDLEKAGLSAIQIDEPALREGLPLRRKNWGNYLKWAVNVFRLSSSGVQDETQIHTHMCYSEFNDIIESIARLDADVITIETSRSNMELLEAFKNFQYPNEIGPGVYDIHSPRIPTKEEMQDLMKKASELLSSENLWVNPDCGLKTRNWEEVKPALKAMVSAAKELR